MCTAYIKYLQTGWPYWYAAGWAPFFVLTQVWGCDVSWIEAQFLIIWRDFLGIFFQISIYSSANEWQSPVQSIRVQLNSSLIQYIVSMLWDEARIAHLNSCKRCGHHRSLTTHKHNTRRQTNDKSALPFNHIHVYSYIHGPRLRR